MAKTEDIGREGAGWFYDITRRQFIPPPMNLKDVEEFEELH